MPNPPKVKVDLTGSLVVRDLSASASTSKMVCNKELRLASPMGAECGGTIVLRNVIVERVDLIGPIKLPKGSGGSAKR
jgi:hypothetical protein